MKTEITTKLILAVLVVFGMCAAVQGNPIPVPPPASMPLEDMHVQIQPAGDGLHAVFTGDFTFDYIPEDVCSMMFPVPPDANNIGAWQDGNELTWTWSSELYPTILPEMPNIPMIEWQGPFPEGGAVFTVDYEHSLIERPQEFIFFYAVGTGKYFPTYDKTTTAYFDILLPAGFAVAGVWLDETPHEYEVVNGHLMVTVESDFGPIINDLIVSLVRTTIYVATDGNDVTGNGSQENPFRTIQKGIDTAVDGHTVLVADGTYTGTGNRDIDFKGKAITVQSENGPENCVIDCEGMETERHRGFYFHSLEDTNSVVQGFTIINGVVPGYEDLSPDYYDFPPYDPWDNSPNHAIGGGIYCEFAGPTIINCVIRNCGTELGGGIGCVGGEPAMINCTISDCWTGELSPLDSGGLGGGVGLVRGCNASIIGCIISDNVGYYNSYGGGIYCIDSSAQISECRISGNSAPGNIDGGGVYCGPESSMMLQNCVISQNTAYNGGGMYSDESSPTLSSCELSGNSADSDGGGVFCYNNGDPTITNCTIAGNSAGFKGGGIFAGPDSDLTMTNCILWDNSAEFGPQIYLFGGSAAATYSDVQGGYSGEGNIDSDPLFVDPNNDDYHVVAGSPCIDAGDPNYPDDPNETDLDGNPRIVNGIVDMGAYEFPGLLYVDDDAPNDPGPGDPNVSDPLENGTEAHPFDTIQEAIDVAQDGYTVLVLQGLYMENICFLGRNITLRSTDPGNPEVVTSTTINGNDANTVVTFSGTENSSCVLTGFTITNGYALDGGGIYGNGTMATIENNVISGNTAERSELLGGRGRGGGLYDCDGLIQKNIIMGNEACGGAGNGGGLYGCDGVIANCVISENGAIFGGGICTGGDMFDLGVPTIVNCTFSGNSAVYGGAILCTEHSYVTIVNSILWGDIAANGPEVAMSSVDFGSDLSVRFSNVEGGQAAIYDKSGLDWGPGNIDADPLFEYPSGDDYHIVGGSPCIDAGDPNYPDDPNETDLDGNPRIVNGIVDMGAYEFPGLLYVDDDAPNDPGPGDPDVSDPLENGTEAHPFDTIQEAIGVAQDGYTVLVLPGLYLDNSDPWNPETIDFDGKNIVVTSADPTDWNIVNDTVIRGIVWFSGTEDANCTLTGFTIRDLANGEIYGNHTHATISYCNISGNGPCGAMVIQNCDGTISNCLITDNTTIYLCGIYPVVRGCHGLIKNCTIANNESGIEILDGGTTTIENCIIYHNSEEWTPPVRVGSGGTLNISYCDLQGGLEGIEGQGNVNWGLGNINTDPCFVRLGYWDGSSDEGDYHLKSEGWRWDVESAPPRWGYDDVTSRCADAGNPGSPLRDEVMTVLPNDPNNDWGINLRINMGAYGGTAEASMPPHGWALLADLTNDGVVSWLDLGGQAEDWLETANEQPGDLNRDGAVNMIDFAMLAEEWMQEVVWEEN